MKINGSAIPLAILIAILLLSGVIFWDNRESSSPPQEQKTQKETLQNSDSKNEPVEILSLKKEDHILGNPQAPVKLITYTDLECPHCQRFHSTMQRIIKDYIETGKVAWVIRQLPIQNLHPNIVQKALAAECVAQFKGDGAFLNFLSKFFGNVSVQGTISVRKTLSMAEEMGIEKEDLQKCMEQEEIRSRLSNNLKTAKKVDMKGTPNSFLLYNGKQVRIRGARPYEEVKEKIETALSEISR